MDTIFALASAKGKSGVAVIRISGPKAADVSRHFGFGFPPHRVVGLRKLRQADVLLDDAMVAFFCGPRSFTGEDVVEIYPHGSSATISVILRGLGEIDGYRHAEPGEFTRRALENERMDLSQVEGLADLVEAETEAQRRQALRVLSGELGNRAGEWRRNLVRAAALLEATIDFVDEDVPIDVMPEVRRVIDRTLEDLTKNVSGFAAAERVRDGFEVAIVGRPNVGKSSLLNSLAGRDAAITSEFAGTTRDVIEVRMDVQGLAVTFLDTAGMREADDHVELLGIELAKKRATNADLRIVLLESRDEVPPVEMAQDDIVLVSKADLREGDISTLTNEGVEELMAALGKVLEDRVSGAGLATRERHRLAIQNAVGLLESAIEQIVRGSSPPELIAEDLNAATRSLNSLVGRVDVEDVLAEIFSSFCIGK